MQIAREMKLEHVMAVLKKEMLFDRLPDEVEIRSAERLRAVVASRIREGEPTTLSLGLEGEEFENVTLAPSLASSLLEMLRLVSSGRGFRMVPFETRLTTQQPPTS